MRFFMYIRKLLWTLGFLLSFLEVYIFWQGFLVSTYELGQQVNSPLIIAFIPTAIFCIIKLLFNFIVYIVIAANYIQNTPLSISHIKIEHIDSKGIILLKIIIYIRMIFNIVTLYLMLLKANSTTFWYNIIYLFCSLILSILYLLWIGSISSEKHSHSVN